MFTDIVPSVFMPLVTGSTFSSVQAGLMLAQVGLPGTTTGVGVWLATRGPAETGTAAATAMAPNAINPNPTAI